MPELKAQRSRGLFKIAGDGAGADWQAAVANVETVFSRRDKKQHINDEPNFILIK